LFNANRLDFPGNFFLIIVLLARVSRLLHKFHENVAICVLKLVAADCCLVAVNVATGVVEVSSTSDCCLFQHQITSNCCATVS